ncbi:MAG: nucleotidyltransferase domain-containing protein, partial [Nanoarchaeota archaeon]
MKKEVITRDYDVAYDFATKVYQKFREVVKSIILFGSTAKEIQKAKSDIDIIIIVDDATIQWTQELIAWYREELSKLIAGLRYPKKLHINTVTLSTFWKEVLVGEPVVINVIRYGIALIDFGGFFEPLKILLARGQIKPSNEAIYNALKRAPFH